MIARIDGHGDGTARQHWTCRECGEHTFLGQSDAICIYNFAHILTSISYTNDEIQCRLPIMSASSVKPPYRIRINLEPARKVSVHVHQRLTL